MKDEVIRSVSLYGYYLYITIDWSVFLSQWRGQYIHCTSWYFRNRSRLSM